MTTATRFNIGVTGVLLSLAAVAWYVVGSGIVGMGSMEVSAPIYMATWLAMLIAMMFPAIAPVVFAFTRVASGRPGGPRLVAGFILGYIVVWTAAGIVPLSAYIASQGLVAAMSSTPVGPMAIGGVLVGAGIYQFSPWKASCLRACRSPLGFVLSHDFDAGTRRAFQAGVSHGAFCLGCCWALMAVLVVVGMMNLAWMGLLSVLFLAEKNWRHGLWLSRVAGGTLALGGLLVFPLQGFLQ